MRPSHAACNDGNAEALCRHLLDRLIIGQYLGLALGIGLRLFGVTTAIEEGMSEVP